MNDYEVFNKPNICWKTVGRNLAFALVESGILLTAPASFISGGIYTRPFFIICVVKSELISSTKIVTR